jgi:hypothetical protein
VSIVGITGAGAAMQAELMAGLGKSRGMAQKSGCAGR